MVYALILAGGSGTRVGGEIPKQYIEINGKPLLYYTLRAFETSDVDGIILVTDAAHMQFVVSEIVDAFRFQKVLRVCEGGAERFDSVRHGLEDLSDVAAEDDIVLIHDGARPYIKPEEINAMAAEAKQYGAAIAAMPVKDTIKISDDAGFVAATTVRKNTWQIQTPQAFHYGLIAQAYQDAAGRVWKNPGAAEQKQDGTLLNVTLPDAVSEPAFVTAGKLFTDDSMVIEALFPQQKIKLVPLSYENSKVTTPEDLDVAKAKLK